MRVPVALIAVAVVLAGCSGSATPHGTKTVIVTAPPPSSSSTAPTSTAPATPTLSPPASMSKIKGTCGSRLDTDVVGPAIHESLPGSTQFVVGQPDTTIKRLSYINCRYGLADANATPTIEIQVSLYPSAAVAAARIAATVADYGSNGASAKSVEVAGSPAKVLTGGAGADYELPTIVMAFGQRTIAVTVSSDIAAAKQEPDLVVLAALAAKRTQ